MLKKPWLKMVVPGMACCTLLAVWMLASVAMAQDEEKPKHTIKEVMKIAQKDKLANKVIAGEASDDEKKMLLDVFISLIDNKPPKGEMDSWQMMTGKLAKAAAKVVVGREGAEAELKAANDCKSCHAAHKPPAN